MKVLANFSFCHKATYVCEKFKRLKPFFMRCKDAWKLVCRLVVAMFAYVHAWHPRRYFIVYHRGQVTDIILRQDIDGLNSQEISRTVKHIHDIDHVLKEMADLPSAPFLYQAVAVPVLLITQGVECEMKAFDLTKVPFWKRWSVVRRVEKGLSQVDVLRPVSGWHQKAYVRQLQHDIGGAKIVSRHVWFGVLKLSASLAALEDWLRRQKRPVMGARWAPVMLAEYLWQSLEATSAWTVLLCRHDIDGFQLFVYHHRLLVLYRQGFVNSFAGGLQEEVGQTMRYAERLGYMPSVGCRVVAYGFDIMPGADSSSLITWQWRPMPEPKEWLVGVRHRWWHGWQSAFQRLPLDRVELSPLRFISPWMAYHLPRWVCAMIVPFIHFAFWSFLVLWVKSSYLSHTISAIEPFVVHDQSQQAEWSSRVACAAGFNMFLRYYAHQPGSLMGRVVPMLGSVGVVQRIRYDASKPSERTISFCFTQKMTKASLLNMKKNLGEEHFCVNLSAQGALQTLHVKQKYEG